MDFLGVGPLEVIFILLIGFLIFGPKRLPEIGRGLGKAVREFKKQSAALTKDFTDAYEDGIKPPPEAQSKSPQPVTGILSDGNASPGKTEVVQPQNLED
ncbi:MAG: twin-arginine translocase TatA/TatE family subunit [Dehalococcoidia bacterium]|nr:twin-arginine translocase TatA/TatE family subunit [Dehalococcoidia bacterium]